MKPAAICFFLCVGATSLPAQKNEHCRFGTPTVRHIQGFEVRLRPYDHESEFAYGCRATVRDAQHRIVFSVSDWDVAIAPIAGSDASTPPRYVVFDGYSGGAHCCWTYYIVSVQGRPGLVKKFENDRGSKFTFEAKSGSLLIQTLDGNFGYFDFLSHAETPFPEVYLRLEENLMLDVCAEHKAAYDETIRDARKKLGCVDSRNP